MFFFPALFIPGSHFWILFFAVFLCLSLSWQPLASSGAGVRYCAVAVEKDRLAPLPPSKEAELDRQAYVREKRFRPLLRCGFPVLKAGKDAPPELLEFTKMPEPNKQLAEHGRRYQVQPKMPLPPS